MRRASVVVAVIVSITAMTGCASTKINEADTLLSRQAARQHRGERVGPPSLVRLRIDVYTLPAGTKDGMEFSVDRLKDKAGDPEALLDALNVYGKAELPYRFDQDLDLGVKTELALVQEVPCGKGVTHPSDGQSKAVPVYWDAGCVVDVSGTWGKADLKNVADVLLKIRLTGMMDLGNGIRAPIPSMRMPEKSVRVSDGVPALVVVLNPTPKFFQIVDASGCVVRLQVDRLKEQS